MTEYSSIPWPDCKCRKDSCPYCHECGKRPKVGCEDCGLYCAACPRKPECYCNE